MPTPRFAQPSRIDPHCVYDRIPVISKANESIPGSTHLGAKCFNNSVVVERIQSCLGERMRTVLAQGGFKMNPQRLPFRRRLADTFELFGFLYCLPDHLSTLVCSISTRYPKVC